MLESNHEVTADSARASGSLWVRYAGVLASVVWLIALLPLACRLARVYPVSSDDATGVLEAAAILRGNLLLSGWSLSSASFALTDLPFYVAGLAFLGPEPSLLRDVPAVIYTVAVAVAVLLARGPRRAGGRPGLGAAAALVMLGLPAGGLAEFVTKAYIRVGTTLGLFAALLAIDVAPGRRVSGTRLLLFGTLLSLTFLSDPYAAHVGAPAILLVCILGAVRVQTYETIRIGWVSLAVVTALLAGEGLTWLIEQSGGYRLLPHGVAELVPVRAVLPRVLQGAGALVAHLPDVYRCGVPTLGTGKSLALWLGCLIGPGFLLHGLASGCPILFRRRLVRSGEPADFAGDVLWTLTVLTFAGFLISRNPKEHAHMRYMLPFVLSGAVLSARVVAARTRSPRIVILALGVLASVYAVTIDDDLRKPTLRAPAEILAGWLCEHGLRHGYGPYWDASIVTASGRGLVAVRPVWVRAISSETHAIEPFPFMADERWFSEGPATFVVYEPGLSSPYQFGVGGDRCVLAFGPARARFAVGPYEILTWNHDLRPLLGRPSRSDPRLKR